MLLHRLFSSCGKQGSLSSRGAQASWGFGFSCGRAQALGHAGFSSCGFRTLERRLSSCSAWASLLCRMWDLSGPGIEPVSPALAGRFFTTELPGKPPHTYIDTHTYMYTHTHIYIYTHTYMYIYTHTHKHIYITCLYNFKD